MGGGPQVGRDVKQFEGIRAQAQGAGTVNGAAIDTAGFDEAVVVFAAGTFTTGTADVKVQESDTAGGTYTDITGAVFPQVSSANDEAVYIGTVRLEGPRKQFIRVVSVVATAASPLAVVVLLAQGEQKPSNTPTFAA